METNYDGENLESNGWLNSLTFQAVWGQPPEAIKVLRGPGCLRETELDEGTIGAATTAVTEPDEIEIELDSGNEG